MWKSIAYSFFGVFKNIVGGYKFQLDNDISSVSESFKGSEKTKRSLNVL